VYKSVYIRDVKRGQVVVAKTSFVRLILKIEVSTLNYIL